MKLQCHLIFLPAALQLLFGSADAFDMFDVNPSVDPFGGLDLFDGFDRGFDILPHHYQPPPRNYKFDEDAKAHYILLAAPQAEPKTFEIQIDRSQRELIIAEHTPHGFQKKFWIPALIDADSITAEWIEKDLLQIMLPKQLRVQQVQRQRQREAEHDREELQRQRQAEHDREELQRQRQEEHDREELQRQREAEHHADPIAAEWLEKDLLKDFLEIMLPQQLSEQQVQRQRQREAEHREELQRQSEAEHHGDSIAAEWIEKDLLKDFLEITLPKQLREQPVQQQRNAESQQQQKRKLPQEEKEVLQQREAERWQELLRQREAEHRQELQRQREAERHEQLLRQKQAKRQKEAALRRQRVQLDKSHRLRDYIEQVMKFPGQQPDAHADHDSDMLVAEDEKMKSDDDPAKLPSAVEGYVDTRGTFREY